MSNSDLFNFNEFYSTYYRKTFLFAKSYVHDYWEAENIVSESLLSMWEFMKQNEIDYPLTFLFSIVKNKSIDYLRREINRQELLSTMSDVGLRELNTRISTLEACDPEKIYSSEIKEIVEATLNALPEKTRNVFLMSRNQGLTKNEIAMALGMTSKGVDYHLSQALKYMRANLKDYLPFSVYLFFYQ